MKRLAISLISAVTILAFTTPTVFAAKPDGFLALGVVGIPDYEGSDDYEAAPLIGFNYRWASGRSVSFGGTAETGRAARLKVNLVPSSLSPTVKAGPVVQYRFGRDGVEDSTVDRLNDVDDAIELGAFLGAQNGPFYVGVTVAADVSDESDGVVTEFAGTFTKIFTDRFTMIFGANITHSSKNYNKTYFGVSPSESAKSGLPAYEPGYAWKDWGISMAASYKADNNWGILGYLKYNLMQGDAESSPVVNKAGDENQYGAGAAITYTF